MIKIFRRRGRGGGWGGGSSEGCLKWGSGGWGSLRDLSKNILKQGWVKAKVVRRGRSLKGVTTPAPRIILIIHQTGSSGSLQTGLDIHSVCIMSSSLTPALVSV